MDSQNAIARMRHKWYAVLFLAVDDHIAYCGRSSMQAAINWDLGTMIGYGWSREQAIEDAAEKIKRLREAETRAMVWARKNKSN